VVWKGGDGSLLGNVYGDGSVFEGCTSDLVTGAWALVGFHEGRITKVTGVLRGVTADINRAELLALLHFLQFAVPGMAQYITDSKFVYDGLTHAGPERTAGARHPWAGEWRKVWHLVAEWGGVAAVDIRLVPAHTSADAVARGIITDNDRYGNSLADTTAKARAEGVRAPAPVRARYAKATWAAEVMVKWVADIGEKARKYDAEVGAASRRPPGNLVIVKEAVVVARDTHIIIEEAGHQKCTRCLCGPTGLRQPCSGGALERAKAAAKAHDEQGALAHRVLMLTSEDAGEDVVLCRTCGAFGSRVLRLLLEPCRGAPSKRCVPLKDFKAGFIPGTRKRRRVAKVTAG
jgi:ribonuclease HI